MSNEREGWLRDQLLEALLETTKTESTVKQLHEVNEIDRETMIDSIGVVRDRVICVMMELGVANTGRG